MPRSQVKVKKHKGLMSLSNKKVSLQFPSKKMCSIVIREFETCEKFFIACWKLIIRMYVFVRCAYMRIKFINYLEQELDKTKGYLFNSIFNWVDKNLTEEN